MMLSVVVMTFPPPILGLLERAGHMYRLLRLATATTAEINAGFPLAHLQIS